MLEICISKEYQMFKKSIFPSYVQLQATLPMKITRYYSQAKLNSAETP